MTATDHAIELVTAAARAASDKREGVLGGGHEWSFG